MNKEQQTDWDELVDLAKQGCGALHEGYDTAIIEADELIKEQQAHIERLRECLSCLIENSDGVAGLHLNGEIAPWASLSVGGHFEEWLLPFSETPAQSLEALSKERSND